MSNGARAEKLTLANYVGLSGGKFNGTTRADLATALGGIADGQRLVVHFHGGLVNRSAGISGAERLLPIYREAGAHPLFFVWQSGLLEVISANLTDIGKELVFKRLVERLLQFALAKGKEEVGGRGGALELSPLDDLSSTMDDASTEPFAEDPEPSEPLSDLQEGQVQVELEQDMVLEAEITAIAGSLQLPEEGDASRGAQATRPATTKMSPDALADLARSLGDEGADPDTRGLISTAWLVKTGVATLKRVIARLVGGRGHGVYPTVVEEVLRSLYLTDAGGAIWRQMKQDIADAFGANPNVHGGTALLAELAQMAAERNPVLVGHSTGAVYICNLLLHAESLPADRRFDVVLLAPACDFALLAKTLAERSDRIGRLRIFCMKDELERQDQMIPLLYPRSLLYFVSGALEGEADAPLVGMHRFYGDGGPRPSGASNDMDRVHRYLREPGRAVWSVASDGDGLTSTAAKHGDFDNDAGTLKSVQNFIQG